MVKREPLTKRQRQILLLMREYGSARFAGGTREFLHWITEQGLWIRAYQQPEYFLKGRGLIEKIASNHPGAWYRLTHRGLAVANRLEGEA